MSTVSVDEAMKVTIKAARNLCIEKGLLPHVQNMIHISKLIAELSNNGLGPIKTEKHECIRIQAKA